MLLRSVGYICDHSDLKSLLFYDAKSASVVGESVVRVPSSMPMLGYHGSPLLTGSEESRLKRLKEERMMCLWRSSQKRDRKKESVTPLRRGGREEEKKKEAKEEVKVEETRRILSDACCCSVFTPFINKEERDLNEEKKSV